MEAFTTKQIEQMRELLREEILRALPQTSTKWVDKDTAMRLLNCGETQLGRLVRAGYIRKSGGNKPRSKKQYNREDIERYHDSNQ